jgi:hypothetical protein
MPRKANPLPDDPEQSKRFIEMAREVEAVETEEEADRAFKKITETKRAPPKKPKLP